MMFSTLEHVFQACGCDGRPVYGARHDRAVVDRRGLGLIRATMMLCRPIEWLEEKNLEPLTAASDDRVGMMLLSEFS